ncbi:MAG: SpoVA/SpoVAEb family sporulation membrane protein [Lachnospiraceae bacterium]|nr:SpoVA/SpoVAEb family sporulation membrane protein [Lachnospiraceae bacterium]
MDEKQYAMYVKSVTPTTNTFANVAKAFLVGGLICVLGQWLTGTFMEMMSWEKDTAATATTLCLVLSSVLLTGLNIFPSIVKFGGAGALVPITGFANSVAAPAIEYKKEGQVFGIGCKIFTIAGPVILYGTFVSWVLGFGYWVGKIMGFIG